MNQACGVVHNAGRNDGTKIYLPLEEVRVHALILDVSARVTITQVYSNPTDVATSRAKYLFPVPASGALCAFEAHKANGEIIVGKCMDKDRAREKHDAAMREGKFTGLLESVTDDIFTISIGSILARETVETKVVYVLTLLNDDNADSIRFHLPAYISQRYGLQPSALDSAAGTTNQTRVRIAVDIQTCGRLHNVISPSHGDEIKEKRYPTHRNRESRRRTTVTYKSKKYLDKDFLLIIHARGLDSPRCFAEINRSASRHGVDTVAFQLTMIPKFDIPELPHQEYIFLVDRSGSMDGERIETAKQTLTILLKLLPVRGTRFNIVGFGDAMHWFSPRSLPYDQATMTRAVHNVDRMCALNEGTQLLMALQKVFQSRDVTVPTAIFVLTDGCVYDEEKKSVRAAVEANVRAAPPEAPLRIFSLGIGNGVSTDICESMARAGNGVCLFATHAESILGKCARLFQAGKTQFVKNVTVDWGVPPGNLYAGSPTVGFATEHCPGVVQLRPPPTLQQSPPSILDLHAGTRQNICSILAVKNMSVPKEVVIQGQLSETGEAWELIVPVQLTQIANKDPTLPPIHTLTAWKLIQDHHERRAPLPLAINIGLADDALRKAAIVRLGESYNVASKYTSFVAVDPKADDDGEADMGQRGRYFRRHSVANEGNAYFDSEMVAPPPGPHRPLAARIQAMWRFANPLQWSPSVPIGWLRRSHSPSSAARERDEGSDDSIRTFSTLSSLEHHSDWSDWSESRAPSPPPLSEEDSRLYRSPSPAFEHSEAPNQPANATTPSSMPPIRLQTEVVALIKLQEFDGSFQLNNALSMLIGSNLMNDSRRQGAPSVVWATALAVAFLKRHATAHKELRIKAEEYLRGQGSEDLVVQADEAME